MINVNSIEIKNNYKNIINKEKLLYEISCQISHVLKINKKTIFSKLLERESLGETLIDKNLSLPHIEIEYLQGIYLLWVNLVNCKVYWGDRFISSILVVIIGGNRSKSDEDRLSSVIKLITENKFCERFSKLNNKEIVNLINLATQITKGDQRGM